MPRISSSSSRPKSIRGREKRQSTRRTNAGTKKTMRGSSGSSSSSSTRRARGNSNVGGSRSSVLSSRTRKAIDTLPSGAQEIYRKAHKNALKQYTSPSKRRGGKQQSKEQVAHRVAWSAVKKEYKKKGDKWLPKKISH